MSQGSIPLYASDIMTRDVVCVDENDHLSHLLDSMRALRFRHMPVTDGQRLVGMLSERDVLQMSASTLLPNREESDELLQKWFYVRDVMTRDVQSVSPQTPIREVAELMLKHRRSSVPVVDEENRLVGIVTSTDLMRLVVKLLPPQ